MARDRRNIDDIERDIAAERDALRRDLERLVNKFTFEDVWRRIGRRIDSDPAVLAETIKRLVREKPFAVGLTGFGLAWLMFGPKQNDVTQERRARHLAEPTQARPAYLRDTADAVHSSAAVHGGEAHRDTVAQTREAAPPGGGTSQASPGTASGEGWTVSTDENARKAGDGARHAADGATTAPQRAHSAADKPKAGQSQTAAASPGGPSRT